MFNLKTAKKITSPQPGEKYLRDHNLGPKADDEQPIGEKMLPHRVGDQYVTTEKQMEEAKKHNEKDAQLIEKLFDEVKSYVPHRNSSTWLKVPPLAALVEDLRQTRMEDWKTIKEEHWSIANDDQAQLGELPAWPKMLKQHDKIVLNNDPRRFDIKGLPSNEDQSKNDKNRYKMNYVKPLVGNVTVADFSQIASQIKTGASIDYDTAIVAILRESEKEQRELTEVEKKAISDLKIKRTQSLLSKLNVKDNKQISAS